MTIFDKISSLLKPKTYEYIIEEPLSQMKLKLDTFFNRGFWKSLWDSEYNVSGSFTNESKTEFKICLTVGPFTKGGANFYYGRLENIDSNSTKVILANNSHIGGIIALIILLLWIVGFIISWDSKNNSDILTFETLFSIILFIGILFIIVKISGVYNDSLKSDFEKLLKKKIEV